MNPTLIVVGLLALAGVVATAIGSYLAVRRTTSGQIKRSDASDLWAESQAMRKELRDEIVQLRADLATARSQVFVLTGQVGALNGEIERMLRRLREAGLQNGE